MHPSALTYARHTPDRYTGLHNSSPRVINPAARQAQTKEAIVAHPAPARSRSRQLLFLACTLPLLATATACGSGSEEPAEKAPESTSSAQPTKSSSGASPTTSSSDTAPNPTLPSDTDQADGGTPEPATSPHNVAPQPERSNGAANTPGTPAPDYNCRNRSAPPLNNTTIPLAGGGSFHYTLKANRYNPCKTLSWIHIAGEHDGPKEAVLLYHNGNPVNSPQPRLITAVTGIQRLGDGAVQVTYRTAQGTTGSVTTRATGNGVQEESTLPASVDSSAPRLAGAHS